MTLRDLLETTSGFRKVVVVYDQEHKIGASSSLLSGFGRNYLDSSVVQIKAGKFGVLLVKIGDQGSR